MRSNILAAPAILILILLTFGCGSEASEDQTVQNSISPNSFAAEDFRLEWEFDEDNVTFTASAPTTGWIAIGFDPSAAMKDANIIIGYVEDGSLYISDHWGDGHTSHKADTELGGTDDVTAIEGSEEDGATVMSFSIPLESADSFDKVLADGMEIKVIIAYGPDGADNFSGYHAWAETVELEL